MLSNTSKNMFRKDEIKFRKLDICESSIFSSNIRESCECNVRECFFVFYIIFSYIFDIVRSVTR